MNHEDGGFDWSRLAPGPTNRKACGMDICRTASSTSPGEMTRKRVSREFFAAHTSPS